MRIAPLAAAFLTACGTASGTDVADTQSTDAIDAPAMDSPREAARLDALDSATDAPATEASNDTAPPDALAMDAPSDITGASRARLDGVLEPQLANATSDCDAGVRVATLELAWRAYEPSDGTFDTSYVASMQSRAASLRAAGFALVLDLGVQYPPDWVFTYPNSRFVDQYGDTFTNTAGPASGINDMNAVFNDTLRAKQSAYATRRMRPRTDAALVRKLIAVRSRHPRRVATALARTSRNERTVRRRDYGIRVHIET